MSKPVVYTEGVSTEPLDIIRGNECESEVGSLAAKRFRAMWNEIERLRAELAQVFVVHARYLVYDIDKHQSSPHFTDAPSQHQGAPGNLDVLVDLQTGKRKFDGEWQMVDRIRCNK